MFKFKHFKTLALSALLIATVSLATYAASVYASSAIKGTYTATDFLDGNIKVEAVTFSDDFIQISFSNKQVLTLTRVSSSKNKLAKGKETMFTASYRGHSWKRQFVVVLDDICLDDYKKTFFVKFTTDIALSDCEKNLVTFKCSMLQLQFDAPLTFDSGGCCLK